MPRGKIYKEPRSQVTIRIGEAIYGEAIKRMEELNIKTFSLYAEKLIGDDLVVAKIERRQQLIEKNKN